MGIITSDRIDEIVGRLKATHSLGLRARRDFQERQKREQEALSRVRVCDVNSMKRIRSTIGSMNGDKISDMVVSDFMDIDVMRAMACVVEAFSRGSLEDIRSFFNLEKSIGSPSVFGYAIMSDIHKAIHTSIIKAPRIESDLIHEYIVGVFGLNRMRSLIPNFAYIYGFFSCSAPQLTKGGEVASYCNDLEDAVTYVAYENIVPSLTMNMLNRTWNFDEFLNSYLQVLLATGMANRECDYTHYDLHDQNVLIRMMNDIKSIKYNLEGEDVYLHSNKIATIIDYGQAHIKYNGNNYGYVGIEFNGVSAIQGFPLFDAYKLLLMSMNTMRTYGNKACFDRCRQLLKFFNDTQSAEDILDREWKHRYSLPREVRGISIDKFIIYCGGDLSRSPKYPILSCTTLECESVNESLKAFGLATILSKTTVEEFTTSYQALTSQDNKEYLLSRLKRDYDEVEQENKIRLVSTSAADIIVKYRPELIDVSKLNSKTYRDEYKNNFILYSQVIQLYQALQSIISDYEFIRGLRRDIISNEHILFSKTKLNFMKNAIRITLRRAQESIPLVKRVKKDEWLRDEFESLVDSYVKIVA